MLPQSSMPNKTAASGDSLLDVWAYWLVLKRRRWVIAATFLLVVVAVTLWTARQPKVYDATCTLIIDLAAPKVLDEHQVQDVVEFGSGSYWYSKEYYETQYKVITSRAVATRVVERLRLEENLKFLGLDELKDPDEQQRARTLVDPVMKAQSRLRVEPVKDSRMVRLRVEDRDPQLASDLANAFADAYIAESLSVRVSTTQHATQWLEVQLADLRQKMRESGDKLFEFKRKHDIVSASWEDRQTMVSQRLTVLNEALSRTQALKAQLQARADAVTALQQEGGGTLKWAEVLAPVANSTLIKDLKLRYADVETECAEFKDKYLENHPRVLSCASRLQSIKAKLDGEVTSTIRAIQQELKDTQATEKNLRTELESTKASALSLNQHEREYQELKGSFETQQRLYDLVLKRLKEADLSGMLHMSNVRILDHARPSVVPIRPLVRQSLLLAVLFGLALGVGLAFGIELVDTSIKAQSQIEDELGLTVLGVVPSLSKAAGTYELVMHEQPKSVAAECCRAIRTNLLFMSPEKPLKTMQVTSSHPREGKTTCAINLAIAMAESGSRVLLIDADMRRPRVHRVFNVANGSGLSSLIVGHGSLDTEVKSTQVANLFVLPCGPIPPNPAELLHTSNFAALLKAAGEKFDRIILDTPPISAVSDAVVVSTQVDGTVIIIKARSTQRAAARATARALSDVKGKIFGAVLNNFDIRDAAYGDYYRRAYGYYYGETEQQHAG